MAYIFINPVVDSMYIKEELNELLINNGYSRVEVENNLVEMLYCTNGCNNGDGVLINE